ncbi:HET domain-containing protein [Fusarium sp. Ph1]|nr:HET domain-containing protein [Fusarium sp. Ph1]
MLVEIASRPSIQESTLAQRQRAGLITRRSLDRSEATDWLGKMIQDLAEAHSCPLCEDVVANLRQALPSAALTEPDGQLAFYPGITAQDAIDRAGRGCVFFSSLVDDEELSDITDPNPDTKFGVEISYNQEFGLSSLVFGYENISYDGTKRGFYDRFLSKYLLCSDQELSAQGNICTSLRVTTVRNRCPYATLSYCWGGDQPFKLIKARLTQHETHIGIKTLPGTIVDAIEVSIRLGIYYLWIDSLCIIQDDPEDVAREINKMADIYQGTTVTISAASSSCYRDGFLNTRQAHVQSKPKFKFPLTCSDGKSGTVFLLLHQSGYPYRDWVPDPINNRSWTLQEHVLSPRILYYSSQQLHWSCKGTRASDGGLSLEQTELGPFDVTMLRFSLSRAAMASTSWELFWKDLLSSYLSRGLTNPMDRRSAISAVGEELARVNHTSFVAGLFESTLAHNLCWNRVRPSPIQPRPATYRAPSWSWAAVDGPIFWSEEHQDYTSMVDNLDCQVIPRFPQAKHGPIESAYLTLLGWVAPAILSAKSPSHHHRIMIVTTGWWEVIDEKDVDATGPELEKGEPISIWLVWMLRAIPPAAYLMFSGLMVVPDGTSTERFRRIGYHSSRRAQGLETGYDRGLGTHGQHKLTGGAFQRRLITIV